MGLWLLEQSPRLSVLDNLTCIQDNNAIVIKDGIELVRHRNNSVTAELLTNHALHNLIGFGINTAKTVSQMKQGMVQVTLWGSAGRLQIRSQMKFALGSRHCASDHAGVGKKGDYLLASSLVKDEDVARAKKSASKAEELFLAVRQVDLIDVCVQAALFLQHREELDALERCQDFFVGVASGWIRVQADCALEEEGVLGDAIDAGADLAAGELADVDSVDCDGTAGHLHHSEETHNHGGFATVKIID